MVILLSGMFFNSSLFNVEKITIVIKVQKHFINIKKTSLNFLLLYDLIKKYLLSFNLTELD